MTDFGIILLIACLVFIICALCWNGATRRRKRRIEKERDKINRHLLEQERSCEEAFERKEKIS